MSAVDRQQSRERLRVEIREGSTIRAALGPLAELRMRVFYEFPYLYVGSQQYEEQYLEVYVQSQRSRVILVWEGERVVGASTVIPLLDAPPEMQAPFAQAAVDLATVDYLGESVLLPEFRGRGLGHKFFELREAHAREYGLSACAFCAVERPSDHPLRPVEHVPYDAFWAKRGYQKLPAMRADFTWHDRDQDAPTTKSMVFWLKRLAQVNQPTPGGSAV